MVLGGGVRPVVGRVAHEIGQGGGVFGRERGKGFVRGGRWEGQTGGKWRARLGTDGCMEVREGVFWKVPRGWISVTSIVEVGCLMTSSMVLFNDAVGGERHAQRVGGACVCHHAWSGRAIRVASGGLAVRAALAAFLTHTGWHPPSLPNVVDSNRLHSAGWLVGI
jgi:hypothetical protein